MGNLSQALFRMPRISCPFQFIPQNAACSTHDLSKELGWMLYDIDYSGEEPMPQFFHARLKRGSLDLREVEVRS